MVQMLGVYACLYHKRDAVDERDRTAHRHEGVHIGRAVQHALGSAHEKFAVDHHYHQRQHKFVYRYCHRVALERQRPVPHDYAHGNVHERYQQNERNHKAYHHHENWIRLVLFFGLIACERGLVARLRNGFANIFCREGCVVFDHH